MNIEKKLAFVSDVLLDLQHSDKFSEAKVIWKLKDKPGRFESKCLRDFDNKGCTGENLFCHFVIDCDEMVREIGSWEEIDINDILLFRVVAEWSRENPERNQMVISIWERDNWAWV